MLCKHSSDAALIHINYARLKSTFKIIHFPTVTNHPMKALMPCWGSYLKLLYKQSYLRRLGGQATTAVSVLYFKNRHQLTPPRALSSVTPVYLGRSPSFILQERHDSALSLGPAAACFASEATRDTRSPKTCAELAVMWHGWYVASILIQEADVMHQGAGPAVMQLKKKYQAFQIQKFGYQG